jgi:tetratricopeptide (TPR) repeat protein
MSQGVKASRSVRGDTSENADIFLAEIVQLIDQHKIVDGQAEPLTGRIENPLSNVVNPSVTRLRIQRAEEDLKARLVPESQIPEKLVEIAKDYAELQQLEKANFYLKQALRIKRRPDSGILHLLGMYHGELGDAERQEKFYREAAELNLRDDGPLFNLARAQNLRKEFDAADATIGECLKRRRSGPALTLKSKIASALGQSAVAEIALRNAFEVFEPSGCRKPLKTMNDWELGWYLHACDLVRDEAKAESAKQEQRRRKERISEPASGLSYRNLIEVVQGVPRPVYKIPLIDIPEAGLLGMTMSALIVSDISLRQ